jgi:hypothetical protein
MHVHATIYVVSFDAIEYEAALLNYLKAREFKLLLNGDWEKYRI